jgi:hypothetical protein
MANKIITHMPFISANDLYKYKLEKSIEYHTYAIRGSYKIEFSFDGWYRIMENGRIVFTTITLQEAVNKFNKYLK